MNDLPRQKLQWIISQYGRAICDDPRRCEALLRDLCPECKREITVLIGALKENVAKELLNHTSSVPVEVLLNRQIRRLYDHLGIAEEFARWAVESWALAVGVLAAPLPAAPRPSQKQIIIAPPAPAQKMVAPTGHAASMQNFTVDVGKGVMLDMMAIPGGTFLMGAPKSEKDSGDDERPQHRVTLAPFYMGKYPVTQAQWEAVMGSNPSKFKGANRPVEMVSWNDAQEFVSRLRSITQRSLSGVEMTFRLPSEAEWEYACRAGTTTPFYFGKTISTDVVNYDGNYPYGGGPKGVYRKQTTDVGQFPPNVFGLYDMHGNVWEWCADTWHENYDGAPEDGSIWGNIGDGKAKLLRGGSWVSVPNVVRCAYRFGSDSDFQDDFIRFRVVRGR